MKLKLLRLLAVPASALFLTSCYVTPGVYDTGYGYDSGYYPGGYYGGGYYSGGVWHSHNHNHNHRKRGGRYYGKVWTGADDIARGAGHTTSPLYRDPHNGGITHGHDAAGRRVDSRGHHVDQFGNHTGGGGGSSFHRHSGGMTRTFSGGGAHSGGGGSHSGGGGGHSHSAPVVRSAPAESSPAPATRSDSGGFSVKERYGRGR